MKLAVLVGITLASALLAGPVAHAAPRVPLQPNVHSDTYLDTCKDTLGELNDGPAIDYLGGGDKGRRAAVQQEIQETNGGNLITGPGAADPQDQVDATAGAWHAYDAHSCPKS